MAVARCLEVFVVCAEIRAGKPDMGLAPEDDRDSCATLPEDERESSCRPKATHPRVQVEPEEGTLAWHDVVK